MVFKLTFARSHVANLQGEGVYQLEVLPHDDSTSGLPLLLDLEVAAVEVKNVCVLGEQKWENPLFEPVSSLIGAAIHKQVLHPGVTVDVTVKKDVSRLKSLTHHHLGGAVLRTLFHTGSYPLSIKIIARQGSSVVTNNDSIRVQHGNNLEYEVVS